MKMRYEMKGKYMKVQRNWLIIMVLSISILFGLLTSENYAVNETNEINSTIEQESVNTVATENVTTQEQTPTASNTETNMNTTIKTTAKSSNANLSDLGIIPHDFTGFRYGTTYYEVAVPEDTESVEVYAKTQHTAATVTGTGMKKLEKGENKAEVVVTAEDGTKKTYTINIIREIQQEETEENEKEIVNIENSNGLAELKIGNVSLSPEFKTDVYEYTVKYIGENTILDIETKPTNEDYIVEVTGNENLQEGENIITILVSEANGDNVATYQITVNKSLVDEEAIAREEAQKKEQQQKKIILGVIVAVIILAIIIFVIIRRKRNKNLAEEFSGAYFYDKEDDEEEYEEEMPRGLRTGRKKPKYIEEEEYNNDYEEEYEEDEIEKISKEKLKEKFLDNYTSNIDADFDEGYQESKRKGRYKAKRFK